MQRGEGSFTAVDGLEIFHQWWHPDGDERGVVMLIHGLGEHSGRYEHVAAALVDAGFAVHAIDHRGHGRSGGKRTFVKSYDEFMYDLSQFRALVVAEHPDVDLIVLGHSMGGNLAVGHALREPDGVAALALSGPALKVGDDLSPAKLKVGALIAKVAPGLRPQGLPPAAISRDPAVVEAYENDPLVYTGKMSAGLGAALVGAMATFPPRYPNLTMPIWLGHGTEDRLCNIEGTRELEAAAVNADVTSHYYEGLYHEIFNEPEQEQVIGDLVSWLDGVTETAAS